MGEPRDKMVREDSSGRKKELYHLLEEILRWRPLYRPS
jgi:hypothetical protein